ncbi:UNVERIFIED_CONTAM: D-beta-hydroxybutyrate dehydrogenase [Trichonephila clavipes]
MRSTIYASTVSLNCFSGCDTGFGFSIAKRLSRKGFQVFAGCLSPFKNGGLELKTVRNVHCLQMDVSREQDINFVSNYIERNLGENKLWAVINNAGISKGSEVEITSMEKIEEVIDVNLLGTIRVTKAFLPLLRKSKGRIINVASAAEQGYRTRLLFPDMLRSNGSKEAIVSKLPIQEHTLQN